jgi:hypothetical protein
VIKHGRQGIALTSSHPMYANRCASVKELHITSDWGKEGDEITCSIALLLLSCCRWASQQRERCVHRMRAA